MASITIRNLDDDVKARLRLAAARHGCSMEEEVRRILKSALLTDDNEYGLGTRIHKLFADLGGIEIPEGLSPKEENWAAQSAYWMHRLHQSHWSTA